MSIPFRLVIPDPIIAALVDQARAESPRECCGLLGGVVAPIGEIHTGGFLRCGLVEQAIQLVNTAKDSDSFFTGAESMLRAVRALRTEGLAVVALYHSHPRSPATPSLRDRWEVGDPNVVHLIISLAPTPTMRAWWMKGSQIYEVDWCNAGGTGEPSCVAREAMAF